MVLWTSSQNERARAVLKKFNIERLFDLVITRENYRMVRYADYKGLGIDNGLADSLDPIHQKYELFGKYFHVLGYPLFVEDGRFSSFAQETGVTWIAAPEIDEPFSDDLFDQIISILGLDIIE